MSKILLQEADYIVPILFLSVFYYDSLYTFWLFFTGNIYSFTEPPPSQFYQNTQHQFHESFCLTRQKSIVVVSSSSPRTKAGLLDQLPP